MSGFGSFQAPAPVNEAVRGYEPGSADRTVLRRRLDELAGERLDVPLVVAGKEVGTGATRPVVMPHRHAHVLADVHQARPVDVQAAIDAARVAWADWSRWPWEERAAVFLRAAELLAGPWRATLTAATMLGQSKTVHQAEIDAACELADFWRFNVRFLTQMYAEQPESAPGEWNRMEYRPLEGFVFAVSPFNFTAIGGNLCTAPALMGNAVVWKPAHTAMLSAHFTLRLLQAAGLPDGVINLVGGAGGDVAKVALASPDLAGVHFTGSTDVFHEMWRTVGARVAGYRNYPRLVGETGGKDFIVAHPSADVDALATAVVRGSFEYQGQKCSAASRVFVPSNLWPSLRDRLAGDVAALEFGDVADFSNFMGAVIDEQAFVTQQRAIDDARRHRDTDILVGGGTDDREGYLVQPTVVETRDPDFRLLRDELFGPVVTVYVYSERRFVDTLALIDQATPYALTGAVFARERPAVATALAALRHAAGNLYVNDKPTGAVVGQQPFGGGRASGTNDKAGSIWNLARWVSPRLVKETFVPATDHRYPHMSGDVSA